MTAEDNSRQTILFDEIVDGPVELFETPDPSPSSPYTNEYRIV